MLLAANAPRERPTTTPLYIACAHVVTKLLGANANVNQAKNDGYTPLYIASELGHTEIVTKLIAANAEVNQPATQGWSPLHKACEMGHADVIARCSLRTSDVDQTTSTRPHGAVHRLPTRATPRSSPSCSVRTPT